jgi:hypothetical protein
MRQHFSLPTGTWPMTWPKPQKAHHAQLVMLPK